MFEVTARLAACTDAAAIAAELRVSLPDLAASQDVQAAVTDVAAFLMASEERWTCVMQSFLSDLKGEGICQDVQVELLDALLVRAAQETVEKNRSIMHMLLQAFQLVVTRLGGSGDRRRWLKWGDLVLAVVHKNAANMENREATEDAKGEAAAPVGSRSGVVKMTVMLMQLRDEVEGGDGATPDLKVVTFVWKVGIVLAAWT
jgi:hypothetical protein